MLTEEVEEMSSMEDEEWRLKNNDGADEDLVTLGVLLRRPNVDEERRPDEPSLSRALALVALEATTRVASPSSSSLAHSSSFSPIDVSDRFDERLLRRRWRVGRPVMVPTSMSLVVPMERKGAELIGRWFVPGGPAFATMLVAYCATVGVFPLSTPLLLASAPVEIVCLCLRCDEERTKGCLGDLETNIYSLGR